MVNTATHAHKVTASKHAETMAPVHVHVQFEQPVI
jgi:hypothetical protein